MKHLETLLRVSVAVVLVSLLGMTIRDGFAATVRAVLNQIAPAVNPGDRNGLNP